jgi:citrate lyase subunit beta / citryl-CoA lyase
MNHAIARSYLFVPASRIDRLEKALAAGAHAVIVDLEDAVALADKESARAALAAVKIAPGSPVYVRVNGPDERWFEEDLRVCATLGLQGVLLPKAETAAQVAHARSVVNAPVLPLIETARGFANMNALAGADGVLRLMFGFIDFQLDLGITGEREELLYYRSQMVLASRLAGIQSPVDGVTTDFNSPECVRDDTLYVKRLGFGGKLCIHPKQVAPVNGCFQPTEDEIKWAKRVLEAARAANGAAVALDGKMVDKPVILKAEEIVREAAR